MTAAEGVDRGFRREYRLCKTDEFSSVFAFRRSVQGRVFELLFRPNPGPSARLGIIVAKRFVRSAVARNAIRRMVRESFRLARPALPTKDLVVRVVARPDFLDRRGLRAEIDGLFTRLAS